MGSKCSFPIFKGKDYIRNCSCYGAVKLLEHRMKMVERVLEMRFSRIVTVSKMQFYLTPDRGTIDAVLILRRLQGEYYVKGKKLYMCTYCMCFVDLEKAFERVPRKVMEWATRKKGMP